MDKLIPQSQDPFLKKPADMALAKFGHLNHLVEKITAVEVSAAASAGTLAAVASNVYADNAAALLGGLVAGNFYSTPTGEIRIVV